jgi:hypothetical protein
MKTFITILVVASLVATSAIAKTAQTNYADGGHIYRSSQSHANPDRGPYPAFRGAAYY